MPERVAEKRGEDETRRQLRAGNAPEDADGLPAPQLRNRPSRKRKPPKNVWDETGRLTMSWHFTKAGRITKRRKLSPEAQAVLDRLGKYLEDNSAETVEILCGFWKDQQDAITYQELRKLVKEGYLDEVTARLWEQDYSVLVKERMPKI